MAEAGPSRKRAASPAAELGVEVVRHDDAWSSTPISDDLLARAARAAFAAVPTKPAGNYEVAVVLTGDAEMRALNRTWRGKDAPTNVLSVPADHDVSGPGFLGDVVLAFETVRNEARDLDIPVENHAAHLAVHGVLHLLGLDHATEAEAERMEALERSALASLGIADPYAEKEPAQTAEVPL